MEYAVIKAVWETLMKEFSYFFRITVAPILLLLTLVLCTTSISHADEINPIQHLPHYFDKLLSNNVEEQSSAALEAQSQRIRIRYVLLEILKKEQTIETRSQIASAIHIVGTLRIAEASTVLVNRINYLETGGVDTSHFGTIVDDYIALGALIEIGKPAVAPALARLLTESDSLNRLLLVTVIKVVEGKEIAKLILENAEKKADEQGKANLQAALKLINPKPGFMKSKPEEAVK